MKEDIRKDYFINNLGIGKICKKYKIGVNKFYSFVSKNETRNISESMKIYHENNDIKMSDETKEKISKSMIKCHSEGRHPGWYHINSDKNNRSYPEKYFLNFLRKNNYFDKYNIIEKYPFSKYYLDFAFVDKKIDVEIDGVQHYREKSIKHDNIRDKFLNDNGWVVYRISWIELFNDKKEFEEFKKFITTNKNKNRYYDKNIIIEEYQLKYNKIKRCECGEIINYISETCKKCYDDKQRKVQRPPYEKLVEEIKELGYCGVGRKYGVSDNSIRKWKKYYEKMRV